MTKKTMLAFGHGYSSKALKTRLPNWTFLGTTRDGRDGTLMWPGSDVTTPLDAATHLLISAAPSGDGDPVLLELRDMIAARATQLEWVGYLSTTGVYGDFGGDWVDEQTPVAPTTERGKRRVLAEADWQSIAGLPLHIFRLAGIYGPSRGPFEKLRRGTARRIVKPAQVFSRIHVEDIAGILAASIARPNPGAIYNLCDDDPQPPEVVIEFAAELMGVPVPKAEAFATANMTPMARSFYAESKRVRNDLIKTELGVVLKYPSYLDGLRADLKRFMKSEQT